MRTTKATSDYTPKADDERTRSKRTIHDCIQLLNSFLSTKNVKQFAKVSV